MQSRVPTPAIWAPFPTYYAFSCITCVYIRVGTSRSVVVQDPVQYRRVGSGTLLCGMLDRPRYMCMSDTQFVKLGNTGVI